MPTESPEILPCPPGDRPEALERLYQRAGPRERAGLVAGLLADEARGAFDLSGLWIARRRGRVVGVLLTASLAGRAGAVWPPEVEPSWGRAEVATALLRAGLEGLRARGMRIAQALLEVAMPRAAADLTRGGLPHVTDLVYLRRPTHPPLPVRPEAPRFTWQSFADNQAAAFAEALHSSYLGSLDMPELEGLRSLDDVVAGHRASGRFDPGRWLIGRRPGESAPAAVVLMADQAGGQAWEVTYLGLAPAARGLGLGRATLAHVLDLARPAVPELELAVDARNAPALRLYEAAGFRPFDRRAVHLALLGDWQA